MSSAEIVRLNKNDYDEAIWLLNHVFSVHRGYPHDFEKMLPKMCKPTDECMGKHFAIRKDGGLKALLGIYPLPTVVADEEIMFSTVGNVVTLKEETGKGYMGILLNEAMKELDRIGADASRLGGKRSRYNRYGYEQAGGVYNFLLNESDAFAKYDITTEIVFKDVKATDTDVLKKGMALYENTRFHVLRNDSKVFYDTLVAWENKTCAAYTTDGEFVGIMSVSQDDKSIVEIDAVSFDMYRNIVLSWLKNVCAKDLTVGVLPHEIDRVAFLSQICEEYTKIPASHFYIRNWEKIAGAFLKLKAEYSRVPDFRMVVGINGYGNICLESLNNNTRCVKTDEKADIELDNLSATRFLFDDFCTERFGISCPALPLPLSWNTQDRV